MENKKNEDINVNSLDVDDILQVLNSWDFSDAIEKPVIVEKTESYVHFDKNDMEACFSLAPPQEGELYTESSVHTILKEKGVKAGIIESTLKAMVKKKVYNRETLIAKGMKAIEGKNGYYQFFFQRANAKSAPRIREDGTVDYANFNLIESVQKDDILAMYHPATKGQAGCDVRGKFLQLHPGKELPPLKGKGFYRNEGSNMYYAAQDGKVEYKDGEIEIRTIYVIEEDVTLTTEKVEFFGDIVINGNVESGVSIRTGKTLTINGTVGACNLYAGGDIILKKGVIGSNKSKIVTKGSLYADFIEHSIVETQKDVYANVIMSSKVESEGKIILTGTEATIIGGYTHAGQAIECKSSGNDVEIRTVMHVGEKPVEKEELSEKENVKEQQMIRKENAKKYENSYIKIDGPINRGTIIGIGENQYFVDSNTSFMQFRNIHGQLTRKMIIH